MLTLWPNRAALMQTVARLFSCIKPCKLMQCVNLGGCNVRRCGWRQPAGLHSGSRRGTIHPPGTSASDVTRVGGGGGDEAVGDEGESKQARKHGAAAGTVYSLHHLYSLTPGSRWEVIKNMPSWTWCRFIKKGDISSRWVDLWHLKRQNVEWETGRVMGERLQRKFEKASSWNVHRAARLSPISAEPGQADWR